MTQHKHLKQRIRERQNKTGESYSTARMHILSHADAHGVSQRIPSSDEIPLGADADHKSSTSDMPSATGLSLESWIARYRLDAEAMRQVELLAVKDGGRYVNLDKLGAWAKAALIDEFVDRAPRRASLMSSSTINTLNVVAYGNELEIQPGDYAPPRQRSSFAKRLRSRQCSLARQNMR